MKGGGKQSTVAVVMATMAVTIALVATTCLAMSIETEPVKVTHRNSGPSYELAAENEVERTRLNAPDESQPEQPQQPPMVSPVVGGEQDAGGEPTPIGHVAIRRIFLFPMMTRGPSDWSSGEREGEQQQAPPRGERPNDQEMPSMFAKPFWPFLTPARPSPAVRHDQPAVHRPHLFGTDEASRSPGSVDQYPAASGEREQEQAHRHHQLDPIQMMLDMMHQAISAQMVPPSDLSKDDKSPSDNAPAESSSDERPKMPGFEMARRPKPVAKNETSEDIVEIEGKKYLRKTVVNRHIGENIIFMTKRLIFVPLNETDSAAPTTETVATTTTDSTTSTTTAASPAADESSSIPDRVGENKPVPTTSSPTETPAATTTTGKVEPEDAVTITAKSEPLSTIAPSASTEQVTSTTVVSTEMASESTTPKPTESFVERVAEVLEKATERMVEEVKPASSTTTTEAPTATTQ